MTQKPYWALSTDLVDQPKIWHLVHVMSGATIGTGDCYQKLGDGIAPIVEI